MRFFWRSSDSIRRKEFFSAWPNWPDFDEILDLACASGNASQGRSLKVIVGMPVIGGARR